MKNTNNPPLREGRRSQQWNPWWPGDAPQLVSRCNSPVFLLFFLVLSCETSETPALTVLGGLDWKGFQAAFEISMEAKALLGDGMQWVTPSSTYRQNLGKLMVNTTEISVAPLKGPWVCSPRNNETTRQQQFPKKASTTLCQCHGSERPTD